MSNLDKEFNKRFQYKKSSSDDFEVESLWEAVEDGLDDRSNKRGVFNYAKWLGALCLFLLIGGTSYWIGSNTKQDLNSSLAEKEIGETMISVDDRGLELQTEAELKINASKTNTASMKPKNDFEVAIKSSPSINKLDLKKDNLLFQTLKKEETFNATQIPTKTEIEEVDILVENNLSTANLTVRSISNSDDLGASKSINTRVDEVFLQNKKTTIAPIQFLETKRFLIQSEVPSLPIINLPLVVEASLVEDSNEDKSAKNIVFALGINGGVNWSNPKYINGENPSFEELKNETERGLIGQRYGVEAALTIKDHWVVQSGVEYHKRWSKFEYTDVRIAPVLKEGVLTTIWTDGADTIGVEYGDTFVNRTSERAVVHYNQSSQISIPLAFGFKNRTGKFTYGITLGTSFNFLLNQSGKLLDEATGILEYDKNSTIAPLNNFTLGINVRPFVGYHLSEKIILGLKPNFMFQKHKATNLQQVGLSIGLEFEF